MRMYILIILSMLFMLSCSRSGNVVINELADIGKHPIGVPAGTIADKLIQSVFPDARFVYFDSMLDAALAVKTGKVHVAAYDEPILRNIAAKNPGLRVLPEKFTTDYYGFAVRLDEQDLKKTMDDVFARLNQTGVFEEMKKRWLPDTGHPRRMPDFELINTTNTLRFGTAPITEPFSFYIDSESTKVIGLDIELAHYIARALGKNLEIVVMPFGDLIPALEKSEVDMIGACITISEERAKRVLFSEPYYIGGIAAMVREG
jgi:polar amino acid transport system substrate-binding protein